MVSLVVEIVLLTVDDGDVVVVCVVCVIELLVPGISGGTVVGKMSTKLGTSSKTLSRWGEI